MGSVTAGTCRLDIGSFTTRLHVRDVAGVYSVHDVMPDVSLLRDGRLPTTAEFQAEADRLLGESNLTRTGDWGSDGDACTAPVAQIPVLPYPTDGVTAYKADGTGVLGCRCVFRLAASNTWERVANSDLYCPSMGHGALYDDLED